jgi:hypothetical protein
LRLTHLPVVPRDVFEGGGCTVGLAGHLTVCDQNIRIVESITRRRILLPKCSTSDTYHDQIERYYRDTRKHWTKSPTVTLFSSKSPRN